MREFPAAWIALVFLAAAVSGPAATEGGEGPASERRQHPRGGTGSFQTTVPAHALDLILARPEKDSVTLSVMADRDVEGFVTCGTRPEEEAIKSALRQFQKGIPTEIIIAPLRANTRYYYQFRFRATAAETFASSPEYTFQTARPAGSTFTFTITADPHLDERADPATYQQTLANALADRPDFHIDLGDTFMAEKHISREAALGQYLAQRYYFGQLCHSAPLFFVLGNHDGEWSRGRGDDGLSVWANLTRKRFFPDPAPDKFYSGDSFQHAEAGLLQDYYSWTWGDALFVVLDPFWFTPKERGAGDNWNRTLGLEQYRWLKETLENSRAKFRFVFIHHLVGGSGDQNRGGSEAAPFYEWGGKNADGTSGFAKNRPDWPAPIHELLVKNHVSAVFHGHDHLYANQELDGIVYLEVPQPGYPGNGRPPRSAAEYGYVNGTILGSSGHLRVTVTPKIVTVEYVSSSPERPVADRRLITEK